VDKHLRFDLAGRRESLATLLIRSFGGITRHLLFRNWRRLSELRPDHGLLFPYRIGEECADQTSPMRDLGANVAPRPERRAGSQTLKVGEVWENPVTGERSVILERSLGQPCYTGAHK
jgi:hypothetical protein